MDSSLHSLVASQMSTPITSSALAQAQTSSTNHPNPTQVNTRTLAIEDVEKENIS